ncbi:MAG: YegP family protein [Bacteroidetes bacterium]|nr:YegP family protein [Bacteroidota bacterium]
MAKPRFELYTDKAGEFRFRLVAGNNEPILASEGYTTKAACQNGIESVKKNLSPDQFEIKEAKNGKFHFVLKAKNHQVIGTSQLYASKDGAKGGTDAVIRAAKDAEVVETEA